MRDWIHICIYVFIFKRIFLVDLFVQEEGGDPKTLGDFNTPQEENNKFKVKIWNSNFGYLQVFMYRKIRAQAWIQAQKILGSNPSLSLDFRAMAKSAKKKKNKKVSLNLAPNMELSLSFAPS